MSAADRQVFILWELERTRKVLKKAIKRLYEQSMSGRIDIKRIKHDLNLVDRNLTLINKQYMRLIKQDNIEVETEKEKAAERLMNLVMSPLEIKENQHDKQKD